MAGKEERCYCSKAYQTHTSFLRHTRTCPAYSDDCRSFLRILACIEPKPVPGDLFYRGTLPVRLWNDHGSETLHRVFGLESIFENLNRLDKAIQSATSTAAVHTTLPTTASAETGPRWAYHSFTLPQSSRNFIRSELSAQDYVVFPPLKRWELETTKLVLHSFPLPDLDMNFLKQGQQLFPFLLPLLPDLPNKVLMNEIPYAIEVCLAATTFGSLPDKHLALLTAKNLALRIAPTPLEGTIQLCEMRLDILRTGHTAILHFSPNPGRKGNSQLAEFLLLRAQQLIERNNVHDAWSVLQRWVPENAAQPSTLEGILSSRMDLMKGKLCRYRGDFEGSLDYLVPLANQQPAPRARFLCRLHLIAVFTELGLWDKGRALLDDTEAVTRQQQRLLQIARAEFHLARGLSGFDTELQSAKKLFINVSQQYEELQPGTRGMRRNYFRVCSGLAIIGHIRRRTWSDFGKIRAIGQWETAYRACRLGLMDGADVGFPDLICLMSMAELKSSLPHNDQAADLSRAQEIRSDLPRNSQRFLFTNLGTRWANKLCEWLKESGNPEGLPSWYHLEGHDAGERGMRGEIIG
ncbi:hypothetical protein QBC35DRAFT_548136 [Podospora australis]|uniref:Uncharacterized protein n=1 Tax=Podospora australis TaxID=1536484 RepID=A0AAN6WID9_9PEZI|nr:hypothetical protein QBC35DRAFT_548136 [Podospora australis]